MKLLNFIFLILILIITSDCKDLPFNNEDIFSLESKRNSVKKLDINESLSRKSTATENELTIPPETEEFLGEDITIISQNLKLTEDTLIQNKRVILDKTIIQTFEYNLAIVAEEFISHQALIQNFPKKQKASTNQNGKNGGNILIKTKTAKGSLQLFLNDESGGFIPRRKISKRDRRKLSGRDGRKGYDAVYRTECRNIYIPVVFGFFGRIPVDRKCGKVCVVGPTKGQNGENGHRGFPGYNGKDGGSSGSFHLKALDLSEFQLTDIQNIPGFSSQGGKGSKGGYGGKIGRNGRDKYNICRYWIGPHFRLPQLTDFISLYLYCLMEVQVS